LEREPRRGAPEILGRLRRDAEEQLDPPKAPRWARPVGWLIAVGIVVVVVIALVGANPL
jgi:hypothetical protein